MDLGIFLELNTWMAILTLTFLEIILGIDNIVFISIVSGKLDKKDQPKARTIGLSLAMIFRIILLFGITYVLKMQEVLFTVNWSWFTAGFTGQSLIIIIGGFFLMYKSVTEIHHKLEGEEELNQTKPKNTLNSAILQIALLNIVFSFDSILTAIGLVNLDPPPAGFGYNAGLLIMIISVVISIIIMMIFAGPVSKFVNEHPTVQILGLSFLLLIGLMLLTEGSHMANFEFFGSMHVNSIPKGYLYFAIFFSLFVEYLNMRFRKNSNPVKLHDSTIKDKALENTNPFD